MKRLVLTITLAFSPLQGFAQSILPQSPVQVPARNLSSTIAVTSTFQNIQAENTARRGCYIENTGTAVMYIFLGALANAAAASSIRLAANQSFSCNQGFSVLTNEVNITGTNPETFSALFW